MSTTLSLQGVRGGTGVTTVIAALGQALHAQGARVLLIECSPEHMLGLHVGLPVGERNGWARAQLDGGDWRSAAFEVVPGLALLPYGEIAEEQVAVIEQWLCQHPFVWSERLPMLGAQFDWVLFDLPQRLPAHVAAVNAHAGCALPLLLANVDPGSHVLLQRRVDDSRRVLTNRYDPATPVQRDLMQLWSRQPAGRLVPQVLHEDASVPEALASKTTIGIHAADSLAAADIDSLAIWCLAQVARLRGPEAS